MPKLIIQDQLKLKQPKVIPIKVGVTVINALKSHFENIDPSKNKLHLNDKILLPNDLPLLNSKLKEGDSLTVTQEVKGGFVGELLSFATLGLSDVVFDAVTGLFTPDIPDFDTKQPSPNNSFSGQKNIIRAFSQKPVVCGSPVIYPDLIGEPIEYYDNNIKKSEQYFYVCHGTQSGGVVQAGNTRLNGITFAGAGFSIYTPTAGISTIPNYRYGRSVDEVDGQNVKGTNEGQDGTTYLLGALNNSTPPNTPATYTGSTFTYYVTVIDDSQALHDARLAAGGSINVRVSYKIYDSENNGTLVEGSGELTNSVLLPEDPGVSPDQWQFTVTSFDGPVSPVDEYNGGVVFDPFDTTIQLPGIIGPFVNPAETDKMFFNIRFDRGLKATVPIKVVVYELDAKGGTRTGVSETFTVSYTEDTVDRVNRTFEINIANGIAWYEFTLERTNAASLDTTKPDVTTLEKVYCITENGDTDFEEATMMKVVMQATQLPTGQGVDNKINIVNGQTEMPSYDVNTGTILPNAPSRIAADALLFVWRDFYKLDTDLLNLDELYTISNSLPENMKTFDYTFDDTSTGVGDVIDIILDVMRVQRYWDGKQIRFWRDEATSINSAILSRADMAPESERSYSLTRSCFVTGQYDSVQIEYVDRSINKKAYIYRSVDSGGNIVNIPGQNPLSKTLTGCQSEDNAINRAELEIRKILYQRWSLSDTFIDSHRFLEKGAVVLYNEVYEGGDAWGGEIVGVSGNTATVRENLELVGGTSYQVFYTNELGDVVGPQVITASTSNSFTCTDLSEVYLAGFEGAQIGSRYYITEVNDSVKRRYRIVERTSSDYNVQLSMIGYDERIYEYDTM